MERNVASRGREGEKMLLMIEQQMGLTRCFKIKLNPS